MVANAVVVNYAIPGAWNIPSNESEPVLASVVAADTTATTFLLNCLPWESDHCSIRSASLTIGPWAQQAPFQTVATGTYDILQTVPVFDVISIPIAVSVPSDTSQYSYETALATWTTSVHCQVVDYTKPVACTTMYGSDIADALAHTIDLTDNPSAMFVPQMTPITIVEGLEKLLTLLPASAMSEVTINPPENTADSAPVSFDASYNPGPLPSLYSGLPVVTDTSVSLAKTTSPAVAASTSAIIAPTSRSLATPQRRSNVGIAAVLGLAITGILS
ncbi:hypothetical protein ANO11243_050840 [Dothideomycetidae sp. 11243]|nr:hypothetical protein ANO11243_050840 [fungal sp. No.11243]